MLPSTATTNNINGQIIRRFVEEIKLELNISLFKLKDHIPVLKVN